VLLVDEMSWPQSPWTVVQLKGEMDAIVASLRFPPGN
jgi:hypothetical protein